MAFDTWRGAQWVVSPQQISEAQARGEAGYASGPAPSPCAPSAVKPPMSCPSNGLSPVWSAASSPIARLAGANPPEHGFTMQNARMHLLHSGRCHFLSLRRHMPGQSAQPASFSPIGTALAGAFGSPGPVSQARPGIATMRQPRASERHTITCRSSI